MKPPRREIERKFLVIRSKLPKRLPKPARVVQGYLATDPVVRLRIKYGKAVIEIKGADGFESSPMPLPMAEAKFLFVRHLEKGTSLIEKDRRVFPSAWKGLSWELDTFLGRHRGLLIAEIELPVDNFRLDAKKFPAWIGKEVTQDSRYKNKNLAKLPRRKNA